MTSQTLYGLPIVHFELRKPESYFQAIDALENLNKVVHDTLQRISTKVAEEKERLQAIENRVNAAQATVDSLADNTSKAVTVLAPPKYPANETLDSIKPLSGTDVAEHRPPRHIDYALDTEHELDEIKPSVALPQLMLFGGLDTAPHVANDEDMSGLGRLPENLFSCSSLLLFNTDDTPYEKYMALDNLLGIDRSNETRIAADSELFAAPRTVAEGDTLPEAAMLDYTFNPQIEQLPGMALPDALGLAGVADISWKPTNNEGGIAPSLAPAGRGRDWANEPRPEPAANTIESKPTTTSTTSTTTTTSSTTNNAATSSPAPTAAPAQAANVPRPPTPPPQPASTPAAAQPSEAAVPPPADEGEPDGRNALLASIRQGKKLKPAKKREIPDAAPAKHGGGATGDIFGDLINALNRRRKGIADKNRSSQGPGSRPGAIRGPPKQPVNPNLPTDDDNDSDDWD